MDVKNCVSELRKISRSMSSMDFMGIFHGSISAKIEHNQFVINNKDAIFCSIEDEDFVLLYTKKDYRWNEASIDSDVHLNIYKNILEAKFVCFAAPPYLCAYSLEHDILSPRDYFSSVKYGEIPIYDIRNFDDWYERAPSEIYRYMMEKNTNVVIIKGYGIYAYERTASGLAKTIALIENSCKILQLGSKFR